jgi:hypothetical protein
LRVEFFDRQSLSLVVVLEPRGGGDRERDDRGPRLPAVEAGTAQPARYHFLDLPGFYHHRACGFSFADGHSQIKRWLDLRTMPPLVVGGIIRDQRRSPNNPDVGWLHDRATRPNPLDGP